jgi:hypothetical protein
MAPKKQLAEASSKALVVTTELVGQASSVTEGTAQVEPQFEVLRFGSRFVRANSYKELHKALLQAEELEEQPVEISFEFDCYPLDGIVAINRALEKVYGFTHAKERMTFFGPRPPRRLNIQVALDESVHVVFGEMAPPAWEGGSLNMFVKGASAPLSLGVSGVIKRKFEPSIKEVVETAKMFLNMHSIYRGKAVELDMSYVGTENFDPTQCAPRFMDVTKEVTLILPRDIEFELQTEVWDVMKRPDDFRSNGISVKRGVLLKGKFGTGKSLTSYFTAQVAEQSGWTYFYLKTPDKFLPAYKLAQLYSPAVLFVEDCDAIFSGERTKEMNSILETLDGVGAKNAEVITVFTTNFPEKINDAFMRSGRVDIDIELTPPDAEAAGRFVQHIARQFLDPEVNIEEVGNAFADLVPADIVNGINRAKQRAIGKFGADIDGKVTTEMLVIAGEIMQKKSRPRGDGLTQSDRDLAMVKKAHAILQPPVQLDPAIKQKVDETDAGVKKIRKAVGA